MEVFVCSLGLLKRVIILMHLGLSLYTSIFVVRIFLLQIFNMDVTFSKNKYNLLIKKCK